MGHKTQGQHQAYPEWMMPYAREFLNQTWNLAAPGIQPQFNNDPYNAARKQSYIGSFEGPGTLPSTSDFNALRGQGGYNPDLETINNRGGRGGLENSPRNVNRYATGVQGMDDGGGTITRFRTRADYETGGGMAPPAPPVSYPGGPNSGSPGGPYDPLSSAQGSPLAQLPPEALQSVQGFDPAQQLGLNQVMGSALQSQALPQQAMQQLMATLGGQYLDPRTNPYLAGAYNTASQSMVNQYRDAVAPGIFSQAAQAGSLGGSAQNQLAASSRYDLGRNLGDLANQMFGGAYESERGRMTEAQGAVPSILASQFVPGQTMFEAGAQRQMQGQNERDTAAQNAMRQWQTPFDMLSQLGGSLTTAAGPGIDIWGQSSRK